MTAEDTPPPVKIWVEATEPGILDDTVRAIWQAANESGADLIGPVPHPTQVDRYLVLRATGRGMRRQQYEIRTHLRSLTLARPSPATLGVLTGLEIPSGVDVRVEA